MQNLTYLLLDAFVVFLALALVWATLKRCFSFVSSTVKLAKHLKSKVKVDKEPVFREVRSCATRIDQTTPEAETKLLTPFPELFNWSQYDSPAYLRKGNLVH